MTLSSPLIRIPTRSLKEITFPGPTVFPFPLTWMPVTLGPASPLTPTPIQLDWTALPPADIRIPAVKRVSERPRTTEPADSPASTRPGPVGRNCCDSSGATGPRTSTTGWPA